MSLLRKKSDKAVKEKPKSNVSIKLMFDGVNILFTAIATMTQSNSISGDYLYLPIKGLAKT
ncbi:hypothetical protein AK966_11030 [Vibrio sp. PID23_8]|nr:hypothetical protein AK966_11030 [Vibrio sp. PID23_8]